MCVRKCLCNTCQRKKQCADCIHSKEHKEVDCHTEGIKYCDFYLEPKVKEIKAVIQECIIENPHRTTLEVNNFFSEIADVFNKYGVKEILPIGTFGGLTMHEGILYGRNLIVKGNMQP